MRYHRPATSARYPRAAPPAQPARSGRGGRTGSGPGRVRSTNPATAEGWHRAAAPRRGAGRCGSGRPGRRRGSPHQQVIGWFTGLLQGTRGLCSKLQQDRHHVANLKADIAFQSRSWHAAGAVLLHLSRHRPPGAGRSGTSVTARAGRAAPGRFSDPPTAARKSGGA
jgi:hypothetical protein